MRHKRNYYISCVILFYVIRVYSVVSSVTYISEECMIHQKKESEKLCCIQ